MKLKKAVRRIDDALYQLQQLQSMLQEVEKPHLARTVAAGMEVPLNELFKALGSLQDKAE
jgi:hypothetical protein